MPNKPLTQEQISGFRNDIMEKIQSRQIKYRKWHHGMQEGVLTGTMKMTERKDEDGEDIFEGDIVENESHCGVAMKEKGSGYIIRSLSSGKRGMVAGVLTVSPLKGKIIGNVYEHPELLNKLK